MVNQNRREMTARTSRNGLPTTPSEHAFPFPCHASTFSVETAIRHLSSAQEDANVGEGFVTDHRQGFGGGGTNRNRAAEDIETKVMGANEAVESAAKALKEAKMRKAKARWHFALEKVTTGAYLGEDTTKLKSSFVFLWRSRFAAILLTSQGLHHSEDMPDILLRGWRLSIAFAENELFEKHPDFPWAHPRSYHLKDIPSSVCTNEVKYSLLAALQSNDDTEADVSSSNNNGVNVVNTLPNGQNWQAVVQFSNEDDYTLFQKKVGSKHGIALRTEDTLPQVQAVIDSTRATLDEASAEYKVRSIHAVGAVRIRYIKLIESPCSSCDPIGVPECFIEA
jgi:hypothetical protein